MAEQIDWSEDLTNRWGVFTLPSGTRIVRIGLQTCRDVLQAAETVLAAVQQHNEWLRTSPTGLSTILHSDLVGKLFKLRDLMRETETDFAISGPSREPRMRMAYNDCHAWLEPLSAAVWAACERMFEETKTPNGSFCKPLDSCGGEFTEEAALRTAVEGLRRTLEPQERDPAFDVGTVPPALARLLSEDSRPMREPTSPEQLMAAADAALSMVKTIRQYLPVAGDSGFKSRLNIIDQWLQCAVEDYTRFERIRNPDKSPWPGPRGSFYVVVPSRRALTYWQELCYAMEPVIEHYGWQGISDGSRISGPYFFLASRPAPPIDPGVLNVVETAARGLLDEFAASAGDGRRIPVFWDQTNDGKFISVTTGEPGLSATTADQSATGEPRGKRQHSEPTSETAGIVFGWSDILTTANRPNTKEEQRRIRRLNKLRNGPIITDGQPRANKTELVRWLSELAKRKAEIDDADDEEQERDSDAVDSAKVQHAFGRTATVAPEIGGSVKPRRGTN